MITRENYEEFFLLYVDNELPATGRQAVEDFVAQHTDLKEELAALLECRLLPDNEALFEDRGSLFREMSPHATISGETFSGQPLPGENTNPLSIDHTNYSEWFLSYIDGELDEKGRRAVEGFAGSHPTLLRELTLLQATVNSPDPTVLFENKEILYREEKTRRIVALPYFRIAAAALVLLAVGLLTLILVRKNNDTSIASRTAPVNKKEQTPVTPKTSHPLYSYQPTGDGHSKIVKADSGQQRMQQDSAGTAEKKHQQREKRTEPQITYPPVVKKEQMSGIAATGTRQEGTTVHTEVPLQVRPPGSLLARNEGQVRVPGSHPAPTGKEADRVLIKADPLLIASTEPAVPEEEDPLLTGSPKKNKLRGFFRKVSRTFEKTASRNDDEGHGILVGNLQIALK